MLLACLDRKAEPEHWNRFLADVDEPPDLSRIDLSGRVLDGYHFTRCCLAGANLSGCSLQRAQLDHVDLREAVFRDADLTSASLQHAVAVGACFDRARMGGANCSWANLQGAQLEAVDLARVRLWKTDLRGAVYPPFTKGRHQDFLSGEATSEPADGGRGTRPVPLTRLLRQLGAMVGTPYRWVGGPDVPMIELPRADEDPQRYLDLLIIDLGLRRTAQRRPDGSVDFFTVG